jgi:hypothetical protein
MTRRILTLIAAGAFASAVASPALAQQPAAPAAPPPAAAPAKPEMAKPDAAKAKPAAKMATKSTTGQIKKVTDTEMIVIVTPKGKNAEEVTFILEKETKIMKGGKVVMVKDVMETETVTITYAEADGKKVAKSVMSKGATAKKS